MPEFKKVTVKTVAKVLRTMADRCDKDMEDAAVYADELNIMLDELLGQDFFGTEGQLDPRGDHRD